VRPSSPAPSPNNARKWHRSSLLSPLQPNHSNSPANRHIIILSLHPKLTRNVVVRICLFYDIIPPRKIFSVTFYAISRYPTRCRQAEGGGHSEGPTSFMLGELPDFWSSREPSRSSARRN
jgi:hypothetical protein